MEQRQTQHTCNIRQWGAMLSLSHIALVQETAHSDYLMHIQYRFPPVQLHGCFPELSPLYAATTLPS
jgi:hypothetical protein